MDAQSYSSREKSDKAKGETTNQRTSFLTPLHCKVSSSHQHSTDPLNQLKEGVLVECGKASGRRVFRKKKKWQTKTENRAFKQQRKL
jgi:hypothetical protein